MTDPIDDVVILDSSTDNLVISEESAGYLGEQPMAVFLYTPDMGNTDAHFHIVLEVSDVKKLHAWLGWFLQKHQPNRNPPPPSEPHRVSEGGTPEAALYWETRNRLKKEP